MHFSGRWTIGWAGLFLTALGVRAEDPLTAWSTLRNERPTAHWGDTQDYLQRLYAPHADARVWFRLGEKALWVRTHREHPGVWIEFPWESEEVASAEVPSPPAFGAGDKPFAGWRVALDPGHIGGNWGPVERRSFSLDGGPVVQEGDLVHEAACRLRPLLEAMGAEVLILHEAGEPATDARPADFYLEVFRDLGRETDGLPTMADVQRRAEIRFYRRAEIEARAERVARWKPHLVLALHIDAGAWADPDQPRALEAHYGHVLINGAYMDGELADDKQRQMLVRRWRRGYAGTELSLATVLAASMAEETGLEPFAYRGENACRVNDNPYVFARNLMANRIYDAPVVYLEPWVLNDGEVYAWASAGDYEGTREINGKNRVSLPAAYADFVAKGLRRWASIDR